MLNVPASAINPTAASAPPPRFTPASTTSLVAAQRQLVRRIQREQHSLLQTQLNNNNSSSRRCKARWDSESGEGLVIKSAPASASSSEMGNSRRPSWGVTNGPSTNDNLNIVRSSGIVDKTFLFEPPPSSLTIFLGTPTATKSTCAMGGGTDAPTSYPSASGSLRPPPLDSHPHLSMPSTGKRPSS
ncbi:hypothetical protein FRC01_013250 [Tulasnella sp. 417]|nr:hypothetical protein FRC01_013250 [Tulasnella sp. 417]